MNDGPMARVAVLGLGAMGLPMAQRLADGRFTVSGFEPDPERAEAARRSGLHVRPTVAEAADGAQVVLVCVRDHHQAEMALFGAAAIEERLAPGARIVLTSTIGVEGVKDLSARMRQASLVDAPVSGGTARARSGDLLILASGADRDLDEVRPVLEWLASSLVVAGPHVGDGQLLKIVNQLLAGVHIAAAAEALTLAARAGLAPESVLDVLRNGAGTSFMLLDRGPRMAATLAGDEVTTHSAIALFVKDLELVRGLADHVDVALPVSRAAGALFRNAADQGLSDADDSSLVRLLAGEG